MNQDDAGRAHDDRTGPAPTLGPAVLAAGQGAAFAAIGAAIGASARRRGGAALGAAVAAAATAPYVSAVRRHRPYSFDAPGLARWVIDSTWSAPNTFAGALFFLHQRARGNTVRPDRTTGTGTIDLERAAIRGYATTVGTVISGSRPRLDAHERVHVTQERLFGPLYGPLVALDYARLILVPTWWRRHDHAATPIVDPRTYLQRGVYPRVWHERWAYSVAPAGSPSLTWRHALRPLLGRSGDGADEWAQQDSNL